MSPLSASTHAEHKALAEELIQSGRVNSWRELGAAFEISAQAAQMRFGRTYGLRIPQRSLAIRHMVSVTLDPELDQRLEMARRRLLPRERSTRASRAAIVRALMDKHLPQLPDDVAARIREEMARDGDQGVVDAFDGLDGLDDLLDPPLVLDAREEILDAAS